MICIFKPQTLLLTVLCIVSGTAELVYADLQAGGDGLIYDPHLDATFYDFSYGPVTFEEASKWVNSLTVSGIDGWRLPKGPLHENYQDYNSCAFKPYNESEPTINDRGWFKATGELGHLFYEEFDGASYFSEIAYPPMDKCNESATDPSPGPVNGAGPFKNIKGNAKDKHYWTGTPYKDHYWNFSFYTGGQGTVVKSAPGYALAVHDGDLTNPIDSDYWEDALGMPPTSGNWRPLVVTAGTYYDESTIKHAYIKTKNNKKKHYGFITAKVPVDKGTHMLRYRVSCHDGEVAIIKGAYSKHGRYYPFSGGDISKANKLQPISIDPESSSGKLFKIICKKTPPSDLPKTRIRLNLE